MTIAPTFAFFDSGIGGFSLLKACMMNITGNYVYYADNANMPYGNKSPEYIRAATLHALTILKEYNPFLNVIACFSASTHLTKQDREHYSNSISMFDLFDYDTPLLSSYRKVGIIGTKTTIQHGALIRHLSTLHPQCTFVQQACPLLAYAIESNSSTHCIQALVEQYIESLLNQSIEGLVLGCTHYEIISQLISDCIGDSIKIISTKTLLIEYIKNKYAYKKEDCKSTLTLISSQHPCSSYDSLVLALSEYATIIKKRVI